LNTIYELFVLTVIAYRKRISDRYEQSGLKVINGCASKQNHHHFDSDSSHVLGMKRNARRLLHHADTDWQYNHVSDGRLRSRFFIIQNRIRESKQV